MSFPSKNHPGSVPAPKGRTVSRLEYLSVGDGAAFSLMVGLGETYLPAFLLALNIGDSASGLIASVPLLVGATAQLATPWLIQRDFSLRAWVVLCAIAQTLSFLPLIYMAQGAQQNLPLAFFAACLYWGAGMSAGPAWNAWMGAMIPKSRRTIFWSRRTWLSFGGSLVGFVGGGLLLQMSAQPKHAFLVLFVLAATFRSVSAIFLAAHPVPKRPHRSGTLRSGLAHVAKGKNAPYLRFMFVMNFSVYLAAPYFTAFMLSELKLSYAEYVGLVTCSLVAKVVSTPYITLWVHRHGILRLMLISSIGIATLPALWLVSHAMSWLVLLQLASGLAWAGLEISFPLYLVHNIPSRDRVPVYTVYNWFRSLCISMGALAGAALLTEWGETYTGYIWIFAISTLLRFASLMALLPVTDKATRGRIFWRTIGVRPSMGSITPPILEDDEPTQP